MRIHSLTNIAVLSAAGAIALTACSNSSTPSTGTGGLNGGASTSGSTGGSNASGPAKTYKIGFEGPLSGDNAQLGINEVNAVQLAVTEANAKPDTGFKLTLVKGDDVGDPAKAPAAAQGLLDDPTILGVIGPSFSGATKAVGDKYGAASLALISPSATNPTLSSKGFKTFHRIVPSDNVEGTQAADWLAKKGAKKVYVIDDLSDYGKGVADAIETELRAKSVSVTRKGVDAKTTDYGAISQQVKSSGADAVFYGGYDAQAGLFAKSLKSTGFTGTTVTGNGGKSSVFTKGAGTAGDGWYFSCGCLDATTAPAAKAFKDAYMTAVGSAPSTYSPEAYDAANALIQAIKDASAKGTPTRGAVNTAVGALDYKGITTEVKFETNGEVAASVQTVNLYQQKAGAIVLLGNIKDQS